MFLSVLAAALICSVIFTMIGVRLGRRFEDGVPAVFLSILFLLQFAVFTVLVNWIGLLSGGLLIALGVLIAIPPFAVVGSQVSQSFGNVITNFLYGGSMMSKAPLSYGKARALLAQGNVDGAIQQYKAYFKESPDVADPLYQAASLLIRQNRLQEAADMYREIMLGFRADIPTWAKAAFALAQLLELRLDHRDAAETIYSQIIVRARGTEPARLAVNRRMEREAALVNDGFE